MKGLIDQKASLEYRSPTGMTPLMKAVGSRNVDAVRTLLDARADVDQKSNSGLTALGIAKSIGDKDITAFLSSSRGA